VSPSHSAAATVSALEAKARVSVEPDLLRTKLYSVGAWASIE
jgi:hypothetical protein